MDNEFKNPFENEENNDSFTPPPSSNKEDYFGINDLPLESQNSDDIMSSSGEPDDLFSTSENQLDLNSFITDKAEDEPQKNYHYKGKKEKGKVKKKTLKILLSVFLILVITGCVSVAAFFIYVFGFVDDSIDQNLYDLEQAYSTTIYVTDTSTGNYTPYQTIHGGQKCEWVDYDMDRAKANDPTYTGIPQNLANAFVAIEDQRFFEHNGVDWKRTLGAFANMFIDLYSSKQGGSTITQQLVKNLTMDNDQTSQRKIREIMRARRLESEYYKDTILECYLNKIDFANGIAGVQVAAKYYFNKEVSDLTIAECATLAAIVKEPQRYRPDKNPENNKTRRKLVLNKMLEEGYITQAEYDTAINEDVKITASSEDLNEIEVNSYFVDALIDDVVDALVEQKGMDRNYAERNIYEGGYKIYSTLNTDIQAIIDEVYTDMDNFKSSSSGQQGQSSFTIMDYSGHVVGIAGGSGEKTTNRGLNRATSSPRQPGSTIKPLSTYSLALENNLITYSSHVKDVSVETSTGKYPSKCTGGTVKTYYALQRSLNAVPVQLASQLGINEVYSHLTKNMGITTLVPATDSEGNTNAVNDLNYSSLCLGGCTQGITTLESCAAFSTFGAKGKYYEPTFFTKVTDQYGNLVLDGETSSKTAMSEETAVIMNHMLQNVVKSGGTGSRIGGYMGKMPTYGKTGTTDDVQNVWFAGGTPYYVASCWYGYDQPETISDSKSAQKIWGQIMQKIHADLEVKDFETSEYVTCRKYCTDSGELATANCTNTAIGWYKTDQLHLTCRTHGGAILDEYDPDAKTEDTDTTSSGTSSTATSSTASSTTTTTTSTSTQSSSNSSTTPISSAPVSSTPVTTDTTTTSNKGPEETTQ